MNRTSEVLSIGEICVEIKRETKGLPLNIAGIFKGPYPSGAPAIFIDTVANLGHRGSIIGGVGEDEFGENCLFRLKKDNVDVSGVKINRGLSTAVAFITYDEDGSRRFIFYFRGSAAAAIGNLKQEELMHIKIVHIMGCSLMIDKKLADKIILYTTKVKQYGGKVSFDPNVRPELMTEEYIRQSIKNITDMAEIILLGVKELEIITGSKDIDEGINNLFCKNTEIVVLKEGAKGCRIYSKYINDPIQINSFNITEVDPTGSGDSFDAGFICGLIEGKELKECGILANACGALNATRFGPMEGVFKRDEVEKFILENLSYLY
jgi:sugar/nucleoside kinase (ribokinase family)